MRVATGFMQYRGGELAADRLIHTIGNFAGVVGSVMLAGIAAGVAERPIFLASLVYSACLLTMLGCSAAYNLAANAARRGFLRQLDHAAIFPMIAGTYTPFTTCRLHGVWAIGMTAAVWTGAITGAAIKLSCPRGIKPGSIVAYLALSWMAAELVGQRLGLDEDAVRLLQSVPMRGSFPNGVHRSTRRSIASTRSCRSTARR
jgi:hemolysin III